MCHSYGSAGGPFGGTAAQVTVLIGVNNHPIPFLQDNVLKGDADEAASVFDEKGQGSCEDI